MSVRIGDQHDVVREQQVVNCKIIKFPSQTSAVPRPKERAQDLVEQEVEQLTGCGVPLWGRGGPAPALYSSTALAGLGPQHS